jgi:apolipoprotein N-acyltransferase
MIISKIQTFSPRQQYAFCVLLGVIGALGFPPLNIIIAPFIAFPLWLYVMELNQDASWKRSFALGFWFSIGYFTTGLYWITFALGVDLDIFWWLVPFALFGIPTALGVYVGVMAVFLRLTHSRGLSRCFWFAALWTTVEIAWSSGPLALPWNPLGSIWSGFDPIFQTLSVVGIYGLTLLTSLLVSFPILFRKSQFLLPQKAFVATLLVTFVGASVWGHLRPENTPVQHKENPPIVRLVQPCVPLEMSWKRDKARAQLEDLLMLSNQKGELTPQIIVWPESALPLLLNEDTTARQVIAQILPSNGYLMAGALRRVFTPGEKPKVFNGLTVVNGQGQVVANYDKHHLVAFGEYLPLRSIIPASISKITSGEMDYSRGTGPATITVDHIPPFSPLICFEGIFSAQVVASGEPRPEWLLNITNDAWFGNSSGPYQHLQLARMRSVEEGLPLVRVANTGISAVFDAFGHEVARKPLQEKGVLDVSLPPALQKATIFAKYGQLIFLVLMVTIVGLGFLTRRTR